MVWNFCEIWKILWALGSRWAKFCEILSHSATYGMYAFTGQGRICKKKNLFFNTGCLVQLKILSLRISSASPDKRCDAGYPCEKKNLSHSSRHCKASLKICWFSVYWPTHLLTLYQNLFWSFFFFRSCLYTRGKKLSIISFCDKIFQKVPFPIAWRYWNF